MLLSFVTLCMMMIFNVVCIVSFNFKKYWAVQLVLILTLIGLSYSTYICVTEYEWTRLEFNGWGVAFFALANIEFIVLLGLWCREKLSKKDVENANNTSKQHKHGFLICCHNSSGNILRTVKSIVKFIPPQDVYVIDNGSTDKEQTATKQMCADTCVQYVSVMEGNKTLAQLIGCYTMLQMGYKYVTICDDDLVIQEWDTEKVLKFFDNDSVKCVSYILLASKQASIWTKFQRIEYALSSYMRYAQSQSSTCFFASGAICTWDINVAVEVLLRHNGEFKGDDMRCGMILHSLFGEKFLTDVKMHDKRYLIKVSEIVIHTQVPVCYMHGRDYKKAKECTCGEPSLYHQRVKSWETSRYCFLFEYVKAMVKSREWSVTLTYMMCIASILIDVFTIASIALTIVYVAKDPFPTFLLVLQVITINIVTLIVCWVLIVKRFDKVGLKWAVIMPVAYYLPNIFFIKLPSIVYSATYLFSRKVESKLFKRPEVWMKYIESREAETMV